MQCVDCVKGVAKKAPHRKTALGGRLNDGKPVVTYGLIAACVVMFVLQLAISRWTGWFQFAPHMGLDEPWRFLTAAFLHSTSFYAHILFNMYALYIAGQFLEPALGRARFTTLCMLSAVGGSVGVVVLTSPTQTAGGWFWGPSVVGASGMVFGLFGAMVVILRRFGANAAQMIGLIAINTVIGFVVPGIAWQAHLGGLAVGLACGWAYAHAPKDKHKLVGWALPVGVVVVLVAATLIRYQLAPGGITLWS